MEYLSTRGEDSKMHFDGALLGGLARDGGLYLPKSWPKFTSFEIASMRGLDYYQADRGFLCPFPGSRFHE